MLKFIFLLSLSALLVSCVKEEKKSDHMTGGSLIGVNYTGEGIQRFSVDNSGGGSIGRYSISGNYCCTMYPEKWTADLRVEVEWVSGHYDNHDKFIVKEHQKTIPIEQYTELGEVFLVFLPKDEVRLYIFNGGPKSPNFPSKLGFPEEPSKTKRITP